MDELKQFRQWQSPTPGHPEVNQARGIENTSGPLGQGHTFAVGAAIAAKFLAAHTGNKSFEKENISPTEAYRKKYRKEPEDLQAISVLTTL